MMTLPRMLSDILCYSPNDDHIPALFNTLSLSNFSPAAGQVAAFLGDELISGTDAGINRGYLDSSQ